MSATDTAGRRQGPAWTPDAARKALGACGLTADDGGLRCPRCGETGPRGKFAIKPDGAVVHHKCGQQAFPVDIIMTHQLGVSWDDLYAPETAPQRRKAFTWLEGGQVDGIVAVAGPAEFAAASAPSTVDIDVFNGIGHYVANPKTASRAAAEAFYGRWHIPPEAVEAMGFGYIVDPDRFNRALVARYGLPRLLACGLFVAGRDGTPRSLVSPRYPVIEPHRRPDGATVFLQFRASPEQERRIAAHKRGECKYPGEKFLSLKGAPRSAQIGGGLPTVAALPDGGEVVIVEGLKDAAAGLAMGKACYGIPGAGYLPPPDVCRLLAGKKVTVSLDGDHAGTTHGPTLAAHLRDAGVAAVRVAHLPDGQDVTDMLVGRHAAAGCGCDACTQWRAAHGRAT